MYVENIQQSLPLVRLGLLRLTRKGFFCPNVSTTSTGCPLLFFLIFFWMTEHWTLFSIYCKPPSVYRMPSSHLQPTANHNGWVREEHGLTDTFRALTLKSPHYCLSCSEGFNLCFILFLLECGQSLQLLLHFTPLLKWL